MIFISYITETTHRLLDPPFLLIIKHKSILTDKSYYRNSYKKCFIYYVIYGMYIV